MSLAWSVGQVITATRLNRRLPVFAYKPASTSRSSTTTMTTDPDLVLALKANTSYVVDGILIVVAASNTPDFKYSFTWTNTAKMAYISHGLDPAGTSYIGPLDAYSQSEITTSPTNAYAHVGLVNGTSIISKNTIIVGANDLTLSLYWAQSTSSADATTLLIGSSLTAIPVS